METPKALDTASREITLIGKSIVIKGEISCGEDLYIDGQVEGAIDPKGNRLTIGPRCEVTHRLDPDLWTDCFVLYIYMGDLGKARLRPRWQGGCIEGNSASNWAARERS